MQTKAQTNSNISKVPAARTYTELAERQRALRADTQKVRVWGAPCNSTARLAVHDVPQNPVYFVCNLPQDLTAVQGVLRQGVASSGATAMRPQMALKPDETASAVEQTNTAAVRALDRPRVPGAHARKPQMRVQAGKENSCKEAANTSKGPPAGLKRPQLQPSTAARYVLRAQHCTSALTPWPVL